MRYMRFIILIIVFVSIILYFFSKTKNQTIKSNQILNNGVVFEGTISNIKVSNNHSFGILFVDLKKSNTKELNVQLDDEMFPYRINNGKAEIYCTVSIDRKKGELIKVNSNNQLIYYLNTKDNEIGSLSLIDDIYNIKFVMVNSTDSADLKSVPKK